MKLKPVIASYTGESYRRIRQYLDDGVLEVVTSVAQSPRPDTEIPTDILRELVEMHVLAIEDHLVRLDTAVFLEADIENIRNAISPLTQELAGRVLECGEAFRNAPLEVTLFLGGILGFVQGVGRNPKIQRAGVDWKNYTGKYAQSKVDFDEICDANQAIGPDILNKTVSQDERFTTVVIGPGGDGNFEQPAPIHITRASFQEYEHAILAIGKAVSAVYEDKLPALETLLRSTTSGEQGMPPANGMLHLGRYIRRLTAKELYANGFLCELIPEQGTVSVSYANDVALIRQLLY